MKEKTLLLVDDEANIIQSLKRLLRKEPYRVLTASCGEEALTLIGERLPEVVVSDQRMPGMSGVELLQKVKEICPHSVRVVLSGYAEAGSIVESINKGEIYRFLGKPWNDEQLKASIRQCFEHYDIMAQNRQLMAEVRKQNEKLRDLNENLEEMVQTRTQSLRLSQDILGCLPVAVVGVDDELTLVIVNDIAQGEFPQLSRVFPGTDIDDFLPAELVESAKAIVSGQVAQDSVDFEWGGVQTFARLKQLSSKSMVLGCVITLSKMDERQRIEASTECEAHDGES